MKLEMQIVEGPKIGLVMVSGGSVQQIVFRLKWPIDKTNKTVQRFKDRLRFPCRWFGQFALGSHP